jgi:hypothetical protein
MPRFCCDCGNALPEGAAFCPGCGERIEATGSHSPTGYTKRRNEWELVQGTVAIIFGIIGGAFAYKLHDAATTAGLEVIDFVGILLGVLFVTVGLVQVIVYLVRVTKHS